MENRGINMELFEIRLALERIATVLEKDREDVEVARKIFGFGNNREDQRP